MTHTCRTLLEVYTPLTVAGEELAFEAYFSYDGIDRPHPRDVIAPSRGTSGDRDDDLPGRVQPLEPRAQLGCRDDAPDNAISRAEAPNWRRLLATCPHATIDASELRVGLPEGQMGNSEVGHLNIGAGRVVYQDYTRIDVAIRDGRGAAVLYARPAGG